jgi:hypothetical protein
MTSICGDNLEYFIKETCCEIYVEVVGLLDKTD